MDLKLWRTFIHWTFTKHGPLPPELSDRIAYWALRADAAVVIQRFVRRRDYIDWMLNSYLAQVVPYHPKYEPGAEFMAEWNPPFINRFTPSKVARFDYLLWYVPPALRDAGRGRPARRVSGGPVIGSS